MTRSRPAVFLEPFQKSMIKCFGESRTILAKNVSSWILNKALSAPL